MKGFAKRLRELRLREKLTIQELSAETEISYTALYNWENEHRVANVNALVKLAQYFGVTTDYFLGLTDD